MAANTRVSLGIHPLLQRALRLRALQVGQTPSYIVTCLLLQFLKEDLSADDSARIKHWAKLNRPGRAANAAYTNEMPEPVARLQPAEATVTRSNQGS